jgi:serine/threonine-protein kinase PRP4
MSSRDSSRSERELSVHSDSHSKATTALPSRNGTHVDRPSRPLYSAPKRSRQSRSRSRSPYRAPPVEKRRRDDELQRPRQDPRRLRYEDEKRDRRQRAYEDRHDGNHKRDRARYDDREDRSHSFKRPRTRSRSRSRSPYRPEQRKTDLEPKTKARDTPARSDLKTQGRGFDTRDKHISKPSASDSTKLSANAQTSKKDAKPLSDQTKYGASRIELSDKYVSELSTSSGTYDIPRPSADGRTDQPEPQDQSMTGVLDEAALIEERRKRREAIKNKYRGQATPLLVQALHVGSEAGSPVAASTPATPDTRKSGKHTKSLLRQDIVLTVIESPNPVSPKTPRITSDPQSPAEMSFARDEDLLNDNVPSPAGNEDEPSAADYDPTADMQEERARHDRRLFKEDDQSTGLADQKVTQDSAAHAEPAAPKKATAAFDMFAEDDEDDIFEEASSKPIQQALPEKKAAQALDVNMMDNWDDPEGYYNTILGELIENRYHVTANLGRGMFSSVVRATDTTRNELVAIKIVRNNDTMRKAGIKEIGILNDIAANDPEDKKHIIRLHRFFDHKGHLCMVFENLSLNLREVLKKFGRDIGINLKAIRAYSQQLFLGLSLLKKCQYLHADLKPDNILVNEGRNMLKICDLGSASSITENITAPYLVSRFYRAPEIILGLPYDTGIDVWSIGCTLFELYTGKILFTGRNNNGMLRSIMECRGRFPSKLLRKGTLTYNYFDDLLNFQAIDEDRVTGRMTTKMIEIKAKPVRDLRARLVPKGKKMEESERKEGELFLDLLDKCLDLRPEKRITPMEALKHPFILRTK